METNLFLKRLKTILQSRNLFKFFVSRLLWYSHLCLFFKIKCKYYLLRFFPTALSASIWLDPDDRRDDEVFLAAYIKKGDIVLDIGANIGTMALASAALTGTEGRVFAFEPHPRIFNYMKSNIKLNGFNNIESFNTALGDNEGTIMLTDRYSDDQNKVQLDYNRGKVHKVSIKPLDTILADKLKNIERIALMKIDVEGYEIFVLRGAQKVLAKCECVYIETFNSHFHQYGYNTNDLLKILIESGFFLYKRNNGKLKRIDLPYTSINCENIIALR